MRTDDSDARRLVPGGGDNVANQQADEDGCLSFHLDACRSGFPVSARLPKTVAPPRRESPRRGATTVRTVGSERQAGSDKVDIAEADEVIDAIAKTVAELASQQNGLIRQQLIEQLIALRRRVSP